MMLKFWIAFTAIFAFTTVGAIINQSLYTKIKNLVPWLTKSFIPTIIRDGNVEEANTIKRDQLPIIDQWYMASLWYGVTTFVLQIILLLSGLYVSVYHDLPFFIALPNLLLLGSTVMFFPRTCIRRSKISTIHKNYRVAYLQTEAKLAEKDKLLDC